MSVQNRDVCDEEIVRKVLGGDVNAYETIVDRYRNMVFGIACRRIPETDVPEVAQNVFIRTYRSLVQYRFECPFKNWISGIAYRECCDYWRRRYRVRELPVSALTKGQRAAVQTALQTGGSNPAADVREQEELSELLRSVLAKLRPEDRMVLECLYFEERSVRETADLMGWSAANVKIRAFRARNRLRELLARITGEVFEDECE